MRACRGHRRLLHRHCSFQTGRSDAFNKRLAVLDRYPFWKDRMALSAQLLASLVP